MEEITETHQWQVLFNFFITKCTTAIKLKWLWCLCLHGRFCYFITF